jgi:hypothetical protein
MTVTAYVEVRSQSPKGSSSGGFSGPDTYVAVQVVPEGVTPLTTLNRNVASKRGIKIIYCGEGYSNRQATPRSMLRQAKAEAQQIAEKINNEG